MDTGVGISEEVLPHVFDLFVQGDHAGRAKSGLGIGLALARRLIDMHGGRIEARSAGTGRGSSFVIHLPVSNSSLQAPVVVDRPNGSPPEVRRRVLVVDDNRDAADTLADLVRTLGGEALTANDGESGARRAAEFAPDVVLLDIGMPGMDGYETCRQLRRSCQYDVFIVALTGWGQEQDKERALASGFDAHLTKPADPSVLARLLAEPTTSREQKVPSASVRPR